MLLIERKTPHGCMVPLKKKGFPKCMYNAWLIHITLSDFMKEMKNTQEEKLDERQIITRIRWKP